MAHRKLPMHSQFEILQTARLVVKVALKLRSHDINNIIEYLLFFVDFKKKLNLLVRGVVQRVEQADHLWKFRVHLLC